MAVFRAHAGVASRAELRIAGVTPGEMLATVRAGHWEAVGRRVLRSAGAPAGPEQALWIAYLAAGPAAVVSHDSAAWLWDLLPAPTRPSLSLPRSGGARMPGVVVHRPRQPFDRLTSRRGFTATDPVRTLADLAAQLPPDELDGVVDGALARGLLTIDAIEAEVARARATGRRGPARLRDGLARRGFLGAPAPSVLESRLHRLLARAGVRPLAVEVHAGPDACYRLDCVLAPTLAIEVDGFAYHASPEQKGHDERRRNRLRLEGWMLLVYTWQDVVHDGTRIVAEVRTALAAAGGGRSPEG